MKVKAPGRNVSEKSMVTIEDAKEVSNVIVEAVRPVSVFVFGSVAKEGVGEDLDLLVIVDDKSVITSDINLTLHKCLKNYYRRFDIDPFIIPLSIFNKYHHRGSPFLRLILKEGRSLYMKEAIEDELVKSHIPYVVHASTSSARTEYQ